MEKINSVTVVGGTHGNELSGIYLLRKWDKQPQLIGRSSFNTQTFISNPKACTSNKRFIDCDLNRQFLIDDLNNSNLTKYEQCRAKDINHSFGPKGKAKTDFIIDLHNTTSNMGACLMLLQSDSFNRRMGAYVKSLMPEAVIFYQDFVPVEQHAFLISMATQGVTIEVGPQPQAVLRQDIMEAMEELTSHVLDYVEHCNCGTLPSLPKEYVAFSHVETLKMPIDDNGNRVGVIHKQVQDRDFSPLRPGDPVFSLFDGGDIYWEGDYEAYPLFINEAAYYETSNAMSLSKKITIEI